MIGIFSVLLRTVHSILLNTPNHLLEEIILADDCSTMPNLGRELEDHLEKLKKVKLVRNLKRLGVTSARVLGFRNARGPIIVSFDSHIEVVKGWLEPLLDQLQRSPKSAVWTVITGIYKDDFSLQHYDGIDLAIGQLDIQ